MIFSSRFFVSLFFYLLINQNESINKNFEIKCEYSFEGRDQGKIHRHKRFVLFPEYKLWLNDWRYLNHPKTILYWISNYYPNKIPSNFIQLYIHHIINDINQFINHQISLVREASSPDKANFNYNFFNYEICPKDDRLATIKDVENIETMLIYPANIIKEKRYRAHGGITLNHENNSSRSYMKFNIHHQFLIYQDFQYDPVEYTCNDDESHCIIDLYAMMLHETLHGFGIEVLVFFEKKKKDLSFIFKHTEKNLPNKNMLAVMHLYASRIMCHDDIRAIRMVYGLSVKRENAKYDDTCRRDFPLNKLQKIMKKIHRWIIFYGFGIGSSISLILFILTMIYIIFKRRCLNTNDYDVRYSMESIDSQQYKKKHKSAMNAFLWHDDYMNG